MGNPPNIIITGSARGIGAATAVEAGRAGYRVCVNYVNNRDAAESVVARIQSEGGEAIAVRADVSDPAQVKLLFEETTRNLGPVTHLVNNAGVPGRIGRVEELHEQTLRRTFEVNVFSAFLCAQEFVKRASTRHGASGGTIVNVSSMAARSGSPGELVHYAAAKAALEAFNYGFAAEVATEGIRVNAVSCGLIDTDIHAEAGDAERVRRYATRMPMQRAGRPEEVAQAIVWLLSDKASYVTGAVLPVAGGR
ncbi:SDR family oxidoreductase [Hydrogenophaga laconesensis]|uniref:NAD(P)-dependent dehydrogenase (Short-subunit alcohol dehydrogenase family) n=1 Tax=Hydrogenophaga laconesensis TaxID=1805971 RepID=A0ABU1VHI9_9BURK|nr:SDR family oxidoreductase [Hydrogenophaga laconesensis]MDR7096940.1 NAD(P)-dependent dehydrogenase (short-subunit alcohol dehydrogenase family) [Hydrogenophaga laconesensis]